MPSKDLNNCQKNKDLTADLIEKLLQVIKKIVLQNLMNLSI